MPARSYEATILMQPVPLARSRHVQGQRPYHTAEVKAALAQVALLTARGRGTFPAHVPVAARLTFDCARWRGDPDNLAKLVLDALQPGRGSSPGSGVLADDRYVQELHVIVRYRTPEAVHIRLSEYTEEA